MALFIFSSKDIDFAKGMAFACKTFYSCGRAVPWFNSILKVLKIHMKEVPAAII